MLVDGGFCAIAARLACRAKTERRSMRWPKCFGLACSFLLICCSWSTRENPRPSQYTLGRAINAIEGALFVA